ncbi:hypothetical protein F3K02_03200 [Hydrogenophaga sp. D2P1]|uniref:O-antigen polymerase n=1 Tax=Hydrogenophaga aromaticivorans TaxID=2610898 RepID=A0A7Y8KWR0_9BURK|nr:hypothetical protein [Hydrogenophaga aromaticivorans]NWF44263.1 hypothetical protein [Hydrogenophaga aromaticivorans]
MTYILLSREVEDTQKMRHLTPPERRIIRKKPRLIFSIFAIFFLIGCYVNIPYGPFPMVSALPFALIGVFIFLPRLGRRQFLAAFGIAVGVFLLSNMAPEPSSFFGTRLLAFFQYVYSIVIGLTLYWTITSFERKQIARFSKFAIIFLLIGGTIEITTGLSSVMDSLMAYFYSLGDYIDIVNNRDVGIGFGFRRPKFFTAETSYFALAYCFLVCAFAWLSEDRRRYALALVFGVLGVLVARSPIPVFSLVFVGLLAIFESSKSRSGTRVNALIIGMVVALPAMALGYTLLQTLFETRLQTISSGDDYSVIYRTYGSLYAALAVLAKNPLFGVGIGSIDLAFTPLTETYLSLDIPASSVFYEWRFQIQNLPSALAIYLGVIGTTYYLVSTSIYVRFLIGPIRWPTIFLFFILSVTEAAFYSPRFNTYLFLTLAISRLAGNSVVRSSRVASSEPGIP